MLLGVAGRQCGTEEGRLESGKVEDGSGGLGSSSVKMDLFSVPSVKCLSV